MRVPIRKRLAPARTQKSLQIPIMRCSAVASLLAYFFSRRQARSRFYRALLAGISNALHSRIAALLRLPNLRRASGGDGRILYEGPFPDRLILKFDSGARLRAKDKFHCKLS